MRTLPTKLSHSTHQPNRATMALRIPRRFSPGLVSARLPVLGALVLVGVLLLSGLGTGVSGNASSTVAVGPIPASLIAATSPTADLSLANLLSSPWSAVHESEPGFALPGARTSSAPLPPTLHVLVTLRDANVSALMALLANLSDPQSSAYHQYLTATEFDNEFGEPSAVYDAALHYFQNFGPTQLVSYADRVTIQFTATPTQTDAIFHVHVRSYVDDGLPYYAPNLAPALPSPLAAYVLNVAGLSDFSQYLIHADTEIEPESHSGSGSIPNPGGSCPFPSDLGCTTVDGLTFPTPITKSSAANGGELVPASDLQVPYDVVPLYQKYGYQKTGETNNTIATLLWSDVVNTDSTAGTFCTSLTSGDSAWDFYAPDVYGYLNDTLPSGEPLSHIAAIAQSGYTYAVPSTTAGREGASATCDGGEADVENTLDVDMAASLSPGATVYQVFGGGGGTAAVVDTDFADVLSPSASEFTSTGGSDATVNINGLKNVSVISNSWVDGGVTGAHSSCIPCKCTVCVNPPGCLVNDSSWYQDLEQAQARGISVLAGTGDSGADNVCSPAAQAYDDFGDIAVGGTTLVLNPTTLERSPTEQGSSSFTVCSGASTYCGGEIGWYCPWSATSGSPCGFLTEAGSVGGVAGVNFTEPSWQSSSSDANSVIRAAAGVNFLGRGEPDIAAIANDTMLTYTFFGVTYSIVNYTNGDANSPISGVSVATPVEAGILNSIDYALMTQHVGRVGFIDPQAYAWGQSQLGGGLTSHPLYDVVHGGNAVYAAATGYDLVTGWGPIDASNWTQLCFSNQSLGIVFDESGLPAAASWSVSIGSVTLSSTGSQITFLEPDGSYSYTIQAPASYAAYPSSGTAVVLNDQVTVTVVIGLASG
jgi:subtilase family serine protease